MIFYSIINIETKSTKEINKVFYNEKEADKEVKKLNKNLPNPKYSYKPFNFKFSEEEIALYRVCLKQEDPPKFKNKINDLVKHIMKKMENEKLESS